MRLGTGDIAGVEKEVSEPATCFRFTPAPTASPTAVKLTPAPYPDSGYGIKDFTRVGNTNDGYCVDGAGEEFTK